MKRKTFELAAKVMASGGNVARTLHDKHPDADPSEIIMYAYDLQAGSYVASVKSPESVDVKTRWGRDLAEVLVGLGVTSVLEAGVGEGTTLRFVADATPGNMAFSGFDISVSRLLYAQAFMAEGGQQADLFAGDLTNIPLADNAVEAIISNHSLEPNGGREGEIIDELLRVASRYLVLIEPDFDMFGDEQRSRMTEHNYVRGLADELRSRPGKLLRHEPWPYPLNPQNCPSLIVFEKGNPGPANWQYVSPISGSPLEPVEEFYFSRTDGFAFPVLHGIPCLLENVGVLASKFAEFAD